jgi:undecaprenyl-diphosphatase
MSRDDGNGARIAAAAVLLGAAAAFVLLARRVSAKRNEPLDQRVRDWTQDHQARLMDVASRPVTLMSIPILVVTATAGLAWWLKQKDRNHAALAIALTPLVAAVSAETLTAMLGRRNPPHAGDSPHGEVLDPSFPSGHTVGVTAEGLAIAYVLVSEDLASPPVLAGLLAWPVLVGVTRVYRDRHWVSDVLGGWAAGTGIAAGAVLLYRSILE